MVLTIDVGNSYFKFALFNLSGEIVNKNYYANKSVVNVEYMISLINLFFKESKIREENLTKVVMLSVVPKVGEMIESSFKRFDIALSIVTVDSINFIENRYISPRKLGVDRLISYFAIREYYSFPAIVVDFGTATTIDIFDINGTFEGGMIIPGINTQLASLAERGAHLPLVAPEYPTSLVGLSTEDCIKNGVLSIQTRGIDSVVDELRKVKFKGKNLSLIITGGLSSIVDGHFSNKFIFEPDFILKSLYLFSFRLS